MRLPQLERVAFRGTGTLAMPIGTSLWFCVHRCVHANRASSASCRRNTACWSSASSASIKAARWLRKPKARYPIWSRDGKQLFLIGYTSDKLADNSHRPVGDAFAVQHFHGQVSYQHGGWSPSRARIAMGLDDSSENSWMMSRSSVR